MDATQQNSSKTGIMPNETKVGRRKFSGEYKHRILAEAAACKRGELGLMLRREGLYSSTLNSWRNPQKTGSQEALATAGRGRKPLSSKAELERLERDLKKTKEELRQAKLIIDVQKKLCMMLGLPTGEEAV